MPRGRGAYQALRRESARPVPGRARLEENVCVVGDLGDGNEVPEVGMEALVFLMSWETPTKRDHDAGHDRGSGRGGGAGRRRGSRRVGGLREEGETEEEREQVMGGGAGKGRSGEEGGKRRQRGSPTDPTALGTRRSPRGLPRKRKRGRGARDYPRGACPPDRPIRAPPRPRPNPAPGRRSPRPPPPPVGSRPNPGAQGVPGAVRPRRRWRIKPPATCPAAPPCAAVRAPPCRCGPRPQSRRLCRLCPGPRPPQARSRGSAGREPGRADMGSRSRARRAAAVLGFTGLLCAVLGAVMIVVVPTLIKQQVLKVGAGRRPGLEGAGRRGGRAAGGRASRSRDRRPGSGPRSPGSAERIARGSWPPPQYPPRPRPRLGARGASKGCPGGAGPGWGRPG